MELPGLKSESHAQVPYTCIISHGQQRATPLVAKRGPMDSYGKMILLLTFFMTSEQFPDVFVVSLTTFKSFIWHGGDFVNYGPT